MTTLIRDRTEVEALLTDRYLESLLRAQEYGADDAPADPALDAAIRRAARRLSTELVRVHPSFRFEERLAARLAETAARMGLSSATGAEGVVLRAPFQTRLEETATDSFSPGDDPVDALAPALPTLPRPLIIGGALTSAAISIAGAAYVAWHRSRPPDSALARAVRLARQAGLGRLAGSVAGPVAGSVADGVVRPRPD